MCLKSLTLKLKGLKARPLKGPLGLYRGFLRLYIRGILRLYRELGLGVPSRGPSYCPLKNALAEVFHAPCLQRHRPGAAKGATPKEPPVHAGSGLRFRV